MILALELVEENGAWLSAREGYVDVIRVRRNKDGDDVAIDIRSEFLRDYLCARKLALRVAQYRQRIAVMHDASYLPWAEKPIEQSQPGERFSTRIFPIDQDGGRAGGEVAVMKVWRTDVDPGDDVPIMGPETDDNTEFKSHSFKRAPGNAVRVEGELWREEWIEPAIKSLRVRGDAPDEQFTFIVHASGEQMSTSALDNEDVGRWLWFRPQITSALLDFRGSNLGWYTRDTGGIGCCPDDYIHFGINERGCVNVYAYDVAKLPPWQQRLWAGHNVAPDGPVCSELLDSQVRAEPADTIAPEAALPELLKEIDVTFVAADRKLTHFKG